MNGASLINSVIGEYRLVDQLGAGGMGEVYRAVHLKIGRIVAVKVLSQSVRTPEFIERFYNEARIQASLQHPNIATLYDFLEFQGHPCIIMEYVEGQTLDELIRGRGVMPLSTSLSIYHSIVDAINYTHSQGIVHRDIKSSNVKISTAGQVKMLDFGIAKSGSSPALTQAGGFIGTLQYLSPEQLKGGYADARSDIWALGVLLYEMVTGYLPFEANTIGELYEKVTRVDFVRASAIIPSTPREIENIISRCLRKNASERYQSAVDLLRDVGRAGMAAPQPGGPSGLAAKGPSLPGPLNNPRALMAGGAAALVLAVAGGLYFITGAGGDGEQTVPATQQIAPQNRSSNKAQPGAQIKSLTIDVAEGRAEVYRNGQKVGSTPYKFEAAQGEQINFTLKSEGFVDKKVDFSVTDNRKVYTFNLDKTTGSK